MKPPLPFPLQLNIGTDIVHLPRIIRLISRPGNYLSRFTRRILTNSEMRDFRARFNFHAHTNTTKAASHIKDVPKTGSDVYALNARTPVTPDMARWLAGRFAAKEAGRKAAKGGAGRVSWKDVVVRVPQSSDTDGHGENEGADVGGGDDGVSKRPEVILFDQCPEGRIARLSISHDGEYVVATVLAAG